MYTGSVVYFKSFIRQLTYYHTSRITKEKVLRTQIKGLTPIFSRQWTIEVFFKSCREISVNLVSECSNLPSPKLLLLEGVFSSEGLIFPMTNSVTDSLLLLVPYWQPEVPSHDDWNVTLLGANFWTCVPSLLNETQENWVRSVSKKILLLDQNKTKEQREDQNKTKDYLVFFLLVFVKWVYTLNFSSKDRQLFKNHPI